LYAPFPSPSGGARADRFVGELGVQLTHRQLLGGAFLPAAQDLTLEPGPRSASRRAGIGVDTPNDSLLVAAVVLVLLLAGARLALRQDFVPNTTK
jgi:hypothetical protein